MSVNGNQPQPQKLQFQITLDIQSGAVDVTGPLDKHADIMIEACGTAITTMMRYMRKLAKDRIEASRKKIITPDAAQIDLRRIKPR